MAANISPQLPRKLREKASKLLCQQCWVPLILVERKGQPKPHPCLFCADCLKRCGSSPKTSEKSWRHCNFAHKKKGSNVDASMDQWKPADTGIISERRKLLHNLHEQNQMGGLKGYHTQQSHDNFEDSNEQSVIRNSVFTNKLRHFDKTATRCGFCPRDSKRGTLVRFCFHCHKHLCPSCCEKHSTERLYRYHATVDLTSTGKIGLQ